MKCFKYQTILQAITNNNASIIEPLYNVTTMHKKRIRMYDVINQPGNTICHTVAYNLNCIFMIKTFRLKLYNFIPFLFATK